MEMLEVDLITDPAFDSVFIGFRPNVSNVQSLKSGLKLCTHKIVVLLHKNESKIFKIEFESNLIFYSSPLKPRWVSCITISA